VLWVLRQRVVWVLTTHALLPWPAQHVLKGCIIALHRTKEGAMTLALCGCGRSACCAVLPCSVHGWSHLPRSLVRSSIASPRWPAQRFWYM